jgi:hypothetical protein
LSSPALLDQANVLQRYFPLDLEEDFAEECLHFRAYLVSTVKEPEHLSALELCQLVRQTEMQHIYPNVDIALRMYLCMAATNCTAERSFSCLKRVKNYLRNSMSHERLNALSLMNIESDLLLSLQYDDVIDSFAAEKSRRKMFK